MPHSLCILYIFTTPCILAFENHKKTSPDSSTVQNNCKHFPCTDEAVHLISSHQMNVRTQNSELRNLFNIIHVFMCAITLPYLNTLGVLNT